MAETIDTLTVMHTQATHIWLSLTGHNTLTCLHTDRPITWGTKVQRLKVDIELKTYLSVQWDWQSLKAGQIESSQWKLNGFCTCPSASGVWGLLPCTAPVSRSHIGFVDPTSSWTSALQRFSHMRQEVLGSLVHVGGAPKPHNCLVP